MIATVVHVYVEHFAIDQFIEATIINSEHSVKEPGNLRFDFLQDESDSSKFVLYEAYETAEDALAHKATDHYLLWKETVRGWMREPRQGIKHKLIRAINPTK